MNKKNVKTYLEALVPADTDGNWLSIGSCCRVGFNLAVFFLPKNSFHGNTVRGSMFGDISRLYA